MPSQYGTLEAESKLGLTSSAQNDKPRGIPDTLCFYPLSFRMWQSKPRGGKGLAPCRPSDEHRVGSENSGTQTTASAPKCSLASGVLSNLPVPRCLSQRTSGTIPQVKTCSLSLSLSFFGSNPHRSWEPTSTCSSLVWQSLTQLPTPGRLKGCKDSERQGIYLMWVDSWRCPLGFQPWMLPSCLLIF